MSNDYDDPDTKLPPDRRPWRGNPDVNKVSKTASRSAWEKRVLDSYYQGKELNRLLANDREP